MNIAKLLNMQQKDKNQKAHKSSKTNSISLVSTFQKPSGFSHLASMKNNQTNSKTPSMVNILEKINTNQPSVANKKSVRDTLLDKIKYSRDLGCVPKREFIVGFNSLMKSAEKQSVSVICLCKDGKTDLVNALIQCCAVRNIPYVVLPSFESSLKDVLGLKNSIGFGVPKLSHSSDDQIHIQASVDDIREYLINISEGKTF